MAFKKKRWRPQRGGYRKIRAAIGRKIFTVEPEKEGGCFASGGHQKNLGAKKKKTEGAEGEKAESIKPVPRHRESKAKKKRLRGGS